MFRTTTLSTTETVVSLTFTTTEKTFGLTVHMFLTCPTVILVLALLQA